MKLRIFLLLFSFISLFAQAKNIDPNKLVQYEGNLFNFEGNFYIGLHFENEKGWHTYWKNPGDAGLPMELEFFLGNEKLELEELEWPTPKKFIEPGNIITFGYDYDYTFFYKVSKRLLSQINGQTIDIKGKWLVCKDICIPGKGDIKMVIEDSKSRSIPSPHNISLDKLLKKLKELPDEIKTPKDLELYIAKGESENELELFFNYPLDKVKHSIKTENFLIPFMSDYFQYKHEKLYRDNKGNMYGKIGIEWNGEYAEPAVKLRTDGVFQPKIEAKFLYFDPELKRRRVITTSFKSFTVSGSKAANDFYNGLMSLSESEGPRVKGESTSYTKSLFLYLLFAFIGGFILNFMPCVLPVISLKLFSLMKQRAKERRHILAHNLSYTAGILSSFLALALTVVALKSGGEEIGWGFQLQSPIFVSIMIIILFIFALNLFGLFEFSTPGGRHLSKIKIEDGYGGDFVSGILATILSTPCSAPFLGTALTFAFTSPAHIIVLTLLFVGLGLAFPFIITGFFPATLKALPRPGAWMENLKKFLGLSMLLTVVWLYDVYLGLIGDTQFVMLLNVLLVMIFFGFHYHMKMGRSWFFKTVFFLMPVVLFLYFLQQSDLAPAPGNNTQQTIKSGELSWVPWSEEKMAELKDEKKLVLMDFTAKWCFTCKINEKVVFDSDDFKELVKQEKITLLLADWTRRDEKIGRFLKKHGLVGVPAYFIQKPDGTLINMGETISISKIKENIK